MPRPARLEALQETLLAGVLGRRALAPRILRGLFADPPAGSVEARWHIYETGLLARASEAIENDFPALAKVLGAGPLRSLTARYLARFPPRSHDIGRLAERLADFLESDGLSRELPFLPDLARLEWALAQAFVVSDDPALHWGDMASLGADGAADLRLQLRAGAALLRSRWPIHDIWSCRDRPLSEIDVPVSRRPCAVLVGRRGLDLVCRALDGAGLRVVETALRGESLAQAIDSWDGEAEALVGAFRRLVDDGVLARLPEGPPSAEAECICGPRRR